jgi:hypothetical protein
MAGRWRREIMILALFLFRAGNPPAAVAAPSLGVSPPKLDLGRTAPGRVFEAEVRVINAGEEDLKLSVEARDVAVVGSHGELRAVERGSPPWSLSSWLSFPTDELRLEPGERKNFVFQVSVPAAAEPGGHYAGIYFRSLPMEGQLKVSVRVGAVISLTVEGGVVRRGELISFRPDRRWFIGRRPGFSLRLANRGNVHLDPEVKVVFRSRRGPVLGELRPPQRQIFPGAVRSEEFVWEEAPWWGVVEAEVVVSGLGDETRRAKADFVVLPPIWLLAPLAMPVLVILGKRRWSKA